jgi:hypothetical protein
MSNRRYHLFLSGRREERALRHRLDRVRRAGGAPQPDEPIELAPERVCLRTGEVLDRRARVRRPRT